MEDNHQHECIVCGERFNEYDMVGNEEGWFCKDCYGADLEC